MGKMVEEDIDITEDMLSDKPQPGDKYIIEIAEVYKKKHVNERPQRLYRIRHFDSLVFTEQALQKLEEVKPQKDIDDPLKVLMQRINDKELMLHLDSDFFDDSTYNFIVGLNWVKDQIRDIRKTMGEA